MAYRIEMVAKYPASTECVVTKMTTLKGTNITVEYWVNNKKYTTRSGISSAIYNKTHLGQKFKINYCDSIPAIALVDYNSPSY
jgi:hypothetical protein